jgi:uncharacterized protein YdhG (YjbR/CyaY superfamily)
MAKSKPPIDIAEYISRFSPEVQEILSNIRTTISNTAPDAKEVISYQMPAFRQHGILVCFAAWKEHIGLYPPISGDAAIEKAVSGYAGPKGNLQFPLNKPIPWNLIKRIVKLRVKQDNKKAEAKRAKRK